MKKLILVHSMSLLILLNGCSSKAVKKPEASLIIKNRFLTKQIPVSLLKVSEAPNPELLKNVQVCRDKKKAKLYVKKLLLAWYANKKKLESIQKLEDLK